MDGFKGVILVDEALMLKANLEGFVVAVNGGDLFSYQSKLLATIEKRLGEDCPALIVVGDGPNPLLGVKKLTASLMALGLSAERASKSIDSFNEAIRCNDNFNNAAGAVIKIRATRNIGNYEQSKTRHRDHGWYRQFEKPHGKRNLKLSK